jgi:hypothetical protein
MVLIPEDRKGEEQDESMLKQISNNRISSAGGSIVRKVPQ